MTSFINDQSEQIQYIGGDLLITKQVANFKNFKIKGDVSISFTVPNTSDNRNTLGYYGLNQTSGPTLSQNAFNLVKDGNTLMRGYLVIEQDNGQELSLYFISGNANWFRSFDFSCKDIRNNAFQVLWNYTDAKASASNTRGIIFPVIDYMFGREKFDKYSFFQPYFGTENDGLCPNNFPCLYISTLVQELAKVAGIRIDGTLLDDKLYQSLIITPEGPELFNETGLISPQYAGSLGGQVAGVNMTVRIEDIAPQMKAIEIIKYLCFKFGCVPLFDEFSKTLTLNILDKYLKADAEDWTDYVVGYNINYDQSENNYVRVKEAPEEEIDLYNLNNADSLFGELLIDSGKSDGSSLDLYTDPFAPVMDNVGTTPINWATPYVQFYELEDGDAIPYTSVTDLSGKASFQAAINLEIESANGLVWRIEDDNAIYTGYHINGLNLQDTYAQSNADYISTSTGYMYPQRITKVKSGPRILVCIPNYATTNFTSGVLSGPEVSISSVAYAYYHKPFMPYASLNGYKPGLSWGEVTFDANDITTPPTPPVTQFIFSMSVTAEASVLNAAKFYTRTNAGSWVLLKTTTVPVYSSYTTFTETVTINEGDTLEIGVQNSSDVNVTFGVTDAPAATYTGYCGQDATTIFTPTSNLTKYVNLKVGAGAFTTC